MGCARSARQSAGCPHILSISRSAGSSRSRYLRTHLTLEQHPPSADGERWRRALELSIVITSYTCFLFNHYYYLIVLVVPMNVLLARYLDRDDRPGFVLWLISYVLISAFLIPTSILTRLTGIDTWAFFINGAWFMYGELLMTALLLREYSRLAEDRGSSLSARSYRSAV